MSSKENLLGGGFGLNRDETNERAVVALLKQPALSYTRDLRHSLENNPDFLVKNEETIRPRIQAFLSGQGIFWDEEILNTQYKQVVLEAIVRMKQSDE